MGCNELTLHKIICYISCEFTTNPEMSNFVGVKPKFDKSAEQCSNGRPVSSKRSTDRARSTGHVSTDNREFSSVRTVDRM